MTERLPVLPSTQIASAKHLSEPLRIFFLAGELSGDMHAARVMSALSEQTSGAVTFLGLGGPRMRELSGSALEDWTKDSAVLGLWEVLRHYRYFHSRMGDMLELIRKEKPAAVVLVDYPGFNLRLAKRLRKEGFAGRVIYYISPQVWAWNRGRIPKMACWLDLMLCIFPFEAALYQSSGLAAEFVGHPLVEELAEEPQQEREANLIGLFPGSRRREVDKLLSPMLDAVRHLREEDPNLKCAIAAASESLAENIRESTTGAEVEVWLGRSHELMRRATVGLVASGTATLEAACFGLPYCLTYKVAPLTYAVGKALVKVPYLGIVNILAEREIVPERIQAEATGKSLAEELRRLLRDTEAREQMMANLAEVRDSLGGGGCAARAARAIIRCLRGTPRG